MPRSGRSRPGGRLPGGLASMRPGQSCPGVARPSRPEAPPPCGFNEAGAIMPRSGRTMCSRQYPGAPGFNEAGAIMPRSGPRTIRAMVETEERASMRPGQSCPGVAIACLESVHHRGNGFNEAGAIMPRSGPPVGGSRPNRGRASMRPGQSCPGVVDDVRILAEDHVALQ